MATTMESTNNLISGTNERSNKATQRLYEEAWFAEYLEKNQLNTAISDARKTLFIQRDKLLERMIRYNKNYSAILKKENYPNKQRDIDKYIRGSKNAAYALSVVCNAIRRLDDLPDEQEWCKIMKDLTKGYKTVNAISTGSSKMTKLAFWIQKAKMEMKGDISASAMEKYYGKPIDELLQSENLNDVASNFLVEDDVLDYSDQDKILDAINGGSVFKISPETVADVADYQSRQAQRSGGETIFNNTEEYTNPTEMNNFDSIPSNL